MRLEFGGKEFELKSLNLNDLVECEDKGIDFQLMRKEQGISMRKVRTLLWIVLKKVDNTVTEEWVGTNMSLGTMEVFKDVVNFSMATSTPPEAPSSDTTTSSEENMDGASEMS